MSLDSYTTQGSNIRVASGILGEFWTRVFPNNGLVKSVVSTASSSEDTAERLMRVMPGWLTGSKDGIMRMDRMEVVPVDRAVKDPGRLGDGFKVGDGYLGEPSGSCRWLVRLSQPYSDIPVLLPLGGKPLLENIDYTVDGFDLVMRENPSVLGVPCGLENVDGAPAASWVFYLPSCIPGDKDVKSNFDFYNAPPEARRQLMDMLTQEGSLSRVLHFLEACAGIRPPTIFEKKDADGKYTSLEATWLEGGVLYGVTSGGDIVSAPAGESLLSGYNKDDNRIGEDSPLTKEVQVFDRYSDSDAPGISTGEILVPNMKKDLGEGETGVVDPTGKWTERVMAAASNAGLDVDEILPEEDDANPVERVYRLLGRKQPHAICLSGKAAERLAVLPACLKAVEDSMPAGSLSAVDSTLPETDSVSVSVEDLCEAFIANELNDVCVTGASDAPFVPRRTIL